MLNKLICFFKGHKRGKRLGVSTDPSGTRVTYKCPRCLAQWDRKGKA